MKIYEVTSGFITFGIGIELQLSEAQAESRMSSLQVRRKGIYGVATPVQFKRGERLGIYEAFLTKSLLENLKEIDKKSENKTDAPTDYPCIQHVSFGKFNVFDKDGNQHHHAGHDVISCDCAHFFQSDHFAVSFQTTGDRSFEPRFMRAALSRRHGIAIRLREAFFTLQPSQCELNAAFTTR